MKKGIILILALWWAFPLTANPSPFTVNLDEIVLDIYNAVSEFGETDYEQLQTDLYALHEQPINLNNTSDEELSQLRFLSPRQIDDILAYADKHPFEELYELRLIPSLADYEIRDLVPFVRVGERAQDNNKVYAHEVFSQARHELIARTDVLNIEAFDGTDPVFAQTRYRFDYDRRVIFGGQLRRPAGGKAEDLQYGAYLQLRDIAPHVHTIVAGNYQAAFGQGLVLAPVFHSGKSMYIAAAGQPREGLRYYSSADGEGMHGAGGTFRWEWSRQTRLDVSALYSMRRANDSTWQHTVGANMTMRHKQLEVQLTAIENIWSDSVRPYTNAKYNQHYFRGTNQAVLGASVRYNYSWFDAFAEVATNQKSQITNARWGLGVLAGSRFYPTGGITLTALYRYYSPWFDNEWGYGFSETSRINDEHGGYLGFDITRVKNWRFSGYGDLFYFSGYKYGLGDLTGTIGYDALAEAKYERTVSGERLAVSGRLRARKKGPSSTYSARAQFDWSNGAWSLRTTADANLVKSEELKVKSEGIPYGISVAQDIAYDFTPYTVHHTPLSLRLRLQAFDARNWANRIYLYEHDVLYAFSIPATYGLGGRAYVCLKWQIVKQLALYLRVSETVYDRKWYVEKHPKWEAENKIPTRTDVHVLLRAQF